MPEAEKGRAVLFVYHESLLNSVTADEFVEDDDHRLDPYHRARQFWESVKGDFPDAIHSIGLNRRGRALMTVTRMHRMGFTDYTIEDALSDDHDAYGMRRVERMKVGRPQ